MSRAPRGATLIEILAGLVILGTLLVSVAIARGRFLRQLAESDRRLAAVRSADKLLATWMSGPPQNVPIGSAGMLEKPDDFSWSTRPARDPAAARLGAILVRMEVFDRSRTASTGAGAPVFAVEFLLHDYRLPRPAPQGAK
jgi:hypothetical protein